MCTCTNKNLIAIDQQRNITWIPIRKELDKYNHTRHYVRRLAKFAHKASSVGSKTRKWKGSLDNCNFPLALTYIQIIK